MVDELDQMMVEKLGLSKETMKDQMMVEMLDH
jgi:hypothetical protein